MGFIFDGKGNGGLFATLAANHGDMEKAAKVVRDSGRSLMGGIEVKVVGNKTAHFYREVRRFF